MHLPTESDVEMYGRFFGSGLWSGRAPEKSQALELECQCITTQFDSRIVTEH